MAFLARPRDLHRRPVRGVPGECDLGPPVPNEGELRTDELGDRPGQLEGKQSLSTGVRLKNCGRRGGGKGESTAYGARVRACGATGGSVKAKARAVTAGRVGRRNGRRHRPFSNHTYLTPEIGSTLTSNPLFCIAPATSICYLEVQPSASFSRDSRKLKRQQIDERASERRARGHAGTGGAAGGG